MTAGCGWSSTPCAPVPTSTRSTRLPASTRGSSTSCCCSTSRRGGARRGQPHAAGAATGQAARLLRRQIAGIRAVDEAVVRGVRHALGIRPVYKTVDTCAAEFAARTPYHYSTYDEENEVAPRDRPPC
jgi:hypothetical protein